MIPKILHFVWIGTRKIPECVKTWEQTHSDWKIIIWNEDKIAKLTLINDDIYKLPNKKYNQKSDIVRLEILYRYGGVYVDADIINLKSIDRLLDTNLFFIQEKQGLLSNSVIGSSVKNRTILDIIRHIKNTFNQEIAVWKSTGPKCITDFLANSNKITIPESHLNYDIVSRTKSLKIYPYYYFNFMYDIIRVCRYKPLTDNMIKITKNRDPKYVKHNGVNIDDVFGVQLWMGGRQANYIRKLDTELVYKNIDNYLTTVFDK